MHCVVASNQSSARVGVVSGSAVSLLRAHLVVRRGWCACACVGMVWIGRGRGEPSPGVYFWDTPPIFHLYPACISPYPWYPVCLPVSIYIYPTTVSHCIQKLYPYVALAVSCCIPRCILVSHRIPPPRKRDITKNTLLQVGLRVNPNHTTHTSISMDIDMH